MSERAHGPYRHGQRWRVVLVAADGARRYRSFTSEALALKYVALWQDETDGRTVSGAVDLYLEHMRQRGLRETTIETAEYRLRALLDTAGRDRALRSLTHAVARAMFSARAAKISGDTQTGELAAARGFGAWCVAQGWLASCPFAELKAKKGKARGKAQLRIDEARRFLDRALDDGTPAGLAAAMALLMGLRASEITGRVVRDVDDDGRVLWIDRAKTKAGVRHLEIPEVLRPGIAQLVADRGQAEPLWGDVDRHWLGYHVRRLCRAAGVPVVTPHGLRGTFGSISAETAPVEHVARALGHVGPAITRRHYLADGAEQVGQQRTALRVLDGGRRR